MRRRLTLKRAGIAVAEEALAKALTRLALAQTAAVMCDECLADELALEICKLSAIKTQLSRGVRFEDSAGKCCGDAEA